MNLPTVDEIVTATLREIKFAPLSKPAPGQRVEICHFSRTGWAVCEADGSCTCRPAEPPCTQKRGKSA